MGQVAGGGGAGVLNAKLWQLWNASWALMGQRLGRPCACLIRARLCNAGDVIRHQLAGRHKSHPFLRLVVTVDYHAPLQTWQAAHKSLPSLMLIRADRQGVTERCWRGRKCDWPHTASGRPKSPHITTSPGEMIRQNLSLLLSQSINSEGFYKHPVPLRGLWPGRSKMRPKRLLASTFLCKSDMLTNFQRTWKFVIVQCLTKLWAFSQTWNKQKIKCGIDEHHSII